MRIKSFWEFINEATLNVTKIGIKYTISTEGQRKISQLSSSLTRDCIFTPVAKLPKPDTKILQIRASKFEEWTWSDFVRVFGITPENAFSQLFVYKTTSRNYPYAVAFLGDRGSLQTTMIKQSEKSGATARADYFRETAFMITLARILWIDYNLKPIIRTKRGIIQMDYHNSEDESQKDAFIVSRVAFKDKYEKFMEQEKIADAMTLQCQRLINYLGSSVNNIVLLQKNSTELAVCKYLRAVIADEREKIEGNTSSYEFLPDLITLSKWNPADMWIGYSGYEWMLSDKKYDRESFDDVLPENGGLPQLNDFLGESISKKQGIIGISLKQQITNAGGVYDVNIKRDTGFVHSYDGHASSGKNKAVNLKFTFEKLGQLIGSGVVDVRTFDTKKNSPISMEVKGSKKSEHMSGKAGSYIKHVMPEKYYNMLVYIQKTMDVDDIKDYIESNYQFTNSDLSAIFFSDLTNPKNDYTNSRLQAVFFTDWFESIGDEDEKNEILGDIIRFAKSESEWSAPHLIVK